VRWEMKPAFDDS